MDESTTKLSSHTERRDTLRQKWEGVTVKALKELLDNTTREHFDVLLKREREGALPVFEATDIIVARDDELRVYRLIEGSRPPAYEFVDKIVTKRPPRVARRETIAAGGNATLIRS